MGNYVDANLTNEEHVVYEAEYHWGFWIIPGVFIVIFLLPFIMNVIEIGSFNLPGILYAFPLISLAIFILTYLKIQTDEFVITNQRLIVKKGIISRETLELHLSKVETVMVSQGPIERLVNAGSVAVRGTGSTLSNISFISEPYEFRRVFQEVTGRPIPSAINDGESSRPIPPREEPQMRSEIKKQNDVEAHKGNDQSISKTKVEQLIQLKELLDSGILTQEEFDAEKKKILNS